ncbi:MAG: hypothetical protein ABWZ25_04105 [Chitinophagaceae bacterium]
MEFHIADYGTTDRIAFTYDNPFGGKVGKMFDKFHDVYEPDLDRSPHGETAKADGAQ